MTKRLTRYHVIVGVLAALLVVTAGSLIGSNMGFKMTRNFNTIANSLSLYGVALPHANPWTASPGSDSENFLDAMWDSTAKTTVGVRRWDNTANSFVEQRKEYGCTTTTCFPPHPQCPTTTITSTVLCSTNFIGGNFSLDAGVGYMLRVGGAKATRTQEPYY